VTRPCDNLTDKIDRGLCRRLADENLIDESTLNSGDGRITPEFYDRMIPLVESRREAWALLKAGRSVPWSRFALEGSQGDKVRKWISSFRGAEDLFEVIRAKIAFDKEETGPARDPLDVYRDGKANCIEFVALFLMAADLLGIPAVPLELFQDAQGNFVEHVRIGIKDPATGRVSHAADLASGVFGKPANGERWVELTRREFLSDYYNLKGVREKDATTAEAEVDFALRLNPRNYLGLYNKAYYAAARGKPTHALSYLLKSIAAYPRYPLAYWNLMRIADQLDRPEIAAWAFERYRDLFTPDT
jgi:tetratricopeptide (TPR) repeat protein